MFRLFKLAAVAVTVGLVSLTAANAQPNRGEGYHRPPPHRYYHRPYHHRHVPPPFRHR